MSATPPSKFEVVKRESIYSLGILPETLALTTKQFFPLFGTWFLSIGMPVVAAIVLIVLACVLDWQLGATAASWGTLAGLLISAGIIGSFWAGWAHVTLKVARGVKTKFTDILRPPGQIVSGLIAVALSSFLIGLGSILVIPGALLFLRWQLAPFYIVDQNCGPIEALKRSWHATDRILLPLIVLDLIFVGLTALSGFLLIGPIVVNMALGVASALVYCKWLTDEDAPFNHPDLIDGEREFEHMKRLEGQPETKHTIRTDSQREAERVRVDKKHENEL